MEPEVSDEEVRVLIAAEEEARPALYERAVRVGSACRKRGREAYWEVEAEAVSPGGMRIAMERAAGDRGPPQPEMEMLAVPPTSFSSFLW